MAVPREGAGQTGHEEGNVKWVNSVAFIPVYNPKSLTSLESNDSYNNNLINYEGEAYSRCRVKHLCMNYPIDLSHWYYEGVLLLSLCCR